MLSICSSYQCLLRCIYRNQAASPKSDLRRSFDGYLLQEVVRAQRYHITAKFCCSQLSIAALSCVATGAVSQLRQF
jgi:hypothetical protein